MNQKIGRQKLALWLRFYNNNNYDETLVKRVHVFCSFIVCGTSSVYEQAIFKRKLDAITNLYSGLFVRLQRKIDNENEKWIDVNHQKWKSTISFFETLKSKSIVHFVRSTLKSEMWRGIENMNRIVRVYVQKRKYAIEMYHIRIIPSLNKFFV